MSSDNKSLTSISEVFRDYGGFIKFIKSKYLWAAALLLVPTYSSWSKPGWWDVVLTVTPSLLGFTIGGFALILAFGDEKFRSLVARAGKDEGVGVLEELIATFLIFIVVQSVGLIAAICCKGLWESSIVIWYPPIWLGAIAWAGSYLIFLYGLMMTIAAARWIHMLGKTYATYVAYKPQDKNDKSQ